MIIDGNLPTLSTFIAEQRDWLENDEYARRLSSDPDLEVVKIMGMTNLQFAEVRDASANVDSPAFKAAASQADMGGHFSDGLFLRQAMFSGSSKSLHGAVKFLSTTSTETGVVSSGAIAAAFDEILGDVSWCFGCPGFTAELVVEQCLDDFGKTIEVPVATTLRCFGDLELKEVTKKGASRCYVSGSLQSTDGSVEYGRASAVFISPSGYDPNSIATHDEARDPEELDRLVLERTEALRTMCAGTGCWQFMTHLPNFEQSRETWAKNLGPGYFADAPELYGKAFLFFLNHSPGSPLRAAVNFGCCAQGPPSTAHGGSRFACLQYAAFHACCIYEEGSSISLEKCKVSMKARLPMNTTAWVEIRVTRKESIAGLGGGVGNRLFLEGQLTTVDGQVIYDALKAEAICRSASFSPASEHPPMAAVVASSKL